MNFVSRQSFRGAEPLDIADFLPSIKGAPVIVAEPHLVFQHPAYQLGDRGILLSSLPPRPPGSLLRNRNSDVFEHELSVARISCHRREHSARAAAQELL